MIRSMETTERLTVTVPIDVATTVLRMVGDGEAPSVSALVVEALTELIESRAARDTYARFEAGKDLQTIRDTDPAAYEWGRGLVARLQQRERGEAGQAAA